MEETERLMKEVYGGVSGRIATEGSSSVRMAGWAALSLARPKTLWRRTKLLFSNDGAESQYAEQSVQSLVWVPAAGCGDLASVPVTRVPAEAYSGQAL